MPPQRKQVETRVHRGFRFNKETMTALDQLMEKYGADAPLHMSLSRRTVLEALIDYAVRSEIPTSTLFRTPTKVEEE